MAIYINSYSVAETASIYNIPVETTLLNRKKVYFKEGTESILEKNCRYKNKKFKDIDKILEKHNTKLIKEEILQNYNGIEVLY